jgi:carboxymethylenebutenolidase
MPFRHPASLSGQAPFRLAQGPELVEVLAAVQERGESPPPGLGCFALIQSNSVTQDMNAKTIDIETKDGVAPCYFLSPPQGGNRPAVIFYMDAFGVRPALCDMAERLASNGYHVLLPNLYYSAGPMKPFDPATVLNDDEERDRMMELARSIDNQLIMEDTESFLEFLERQPSIAGQKIGCVGYCMGGAFALSAAGTFPDRIAAAASLHGARLATDQPDSPHLLAPKMRARIYVGIAGIDPHFTPAEKQRLETALQSTSLEQTVEVYANVKHGFAVNDTPAYDRAASERHWSQLLKLFQALG